MKEGQDSENTNKFPSDNLNLIISTHWWCVLNRPAISINKTGSKGKILDWVQPWTFDVHEGINWRRKSRFLMGLTLVNKEGTERVELTDLGGRSRSERGHQIGWKNTLQGWGGWRVTMVPNSIPSQEKEMRGSSRKQLVDLCYFPEWYCFISLPSGLQSSIKDWKFQDTIELVCFVFVYLYL